MTALIAAVLVVQTPVSWFDRSLAAHAALKSFSVQAVVTGKEQGRSQKSTSTLDVSGNDVLFHYQRPAAGKLDRLDLTFLMKGNTLVAYDRVANERLERSVPSKGGRATRLEEGTGAMEEAPAVIIDASRMKVMYTGLKGMSGWKESMGPGTRKLTRSAGKSSSRLVFDAKTNLLKELYLKNPGTELLWKVTWSTPKPPTFSIPKGAKKVASFMESEAPPTFLSKAARSTYDSLLSAASRLKSAMVVIGEDGSATSIAYNTRSVRESQPRAAWAFSGKTLTVRAPSGTYYSGRAGQGEVIDIVGQLGARVSPFTRNLLLKRVPFKNYFAFGDRIGLVGSVTIDGVKCSILRGTNPRRRTSILVRADNHLPKSVTTEQLDGRGGVLGTSNLEFTFSQMNGTLTPSALALPIPSGKRPKALPKAKLPSS